MNECPRCKIELLVGWDDIDAGKPFYYHPAWDKRTNCNYSMDLMPECNHSLSTIARILEAGLPCPKCGEKL